jgi:hypothetical protein
MKATSYDIFRNGKKLRPDLNKEEWDKIEWVELAEVENKINDKFLWESIINEYGNNELSEELLIIIKNKILNYIRGDEK